MRPTSAGIRRLVRRPVIDATRFDGLVRSLAHATSRRRSLGVLLGGTAVLLAGSSAGEARPRLAGPRKKKKCKHGTTRCSKACVNTTTDPANCGGCGNQCIAPETCGGGGTPGVCGCTPDCAGKCAGGADGCGGACTGGCAGGRVCLSNGTCALPCPGGLNGCGDAGCSANRCIGTNEGGICSLGNGSGSCSQSNADCPTGRACSGVLCEIAC